MGLTAFPNGISSFGIPVIGAGPILTTGSVFFVSSTTGSDGASGKDASQPLATIDCAIGKCTASKGDVIFVMPGHAETIASATTLVPDVAGVSIIGLGNGSNRPTLTLSATDSKIAVSAANITLQNFNIVGGITNIVTVFDISATGDEFSLLGCDCYPSVSTYDVLMWFTTIENADGLRIEGCRFSGNNAGPTECIELIGVDRAVIRNNRIVGDYSVSAISAITTPCLEIVIEDNFIMNANVAGFCIDLVASCTGSIAKNNLWSGYATDLTKCVDSSSCACTLNYMTNAAGETGALIPATPSA